MMQSRTNRLIDICRASHVDIVYAFGSQAEQVKAWLQGRIRQIITQGLSDVDIGVVPSPGYALDVREKVALTIALEGLFSVGNVDLVVLPEADPFVAANVIRGERLYAGDPHRADEYDLYVLRRAGDLAPYERKKLALIFGDSR